MDPVIVSSAVTNLVTGFLIALWICVIGYAIWTFIVRPFIAGWRRGTDKKRAARNQPIRPMSDYDVNLAILAMEKRINRAEHL